MQDNFSDLIKKYRYDNKLSQNDFIDILTANHGFSSKLDVVTLSRWENEKTTPSLEKKIRIMRKINLLVTYLYGISNFDEKTKIGKSLNYRFGMEITKYKELNNFRNQEKINFEFLKNKNNLHTNVKQYLTAQKRGHCNICKQWPINIGSWRSNEKIDAFFIHLYTNDEVYNQGHCKNWDELYKPTNKKNINSILILEQVTSSRVFYKLSLLCLFDTLIKNDHLDYVFIQVNTDYFLKLALFIGFDTITTIEEHLTNITDHMDLKFTCIMKIKTEKLLANKDFLFFCLKNYNDLKIQNPTLLDLIYSSDRVSEFNN